MKWVKQNLIVIVSVCIFVVLLAAVCWLAQSAIGKLKGVEADLDTKRTKLEGMRGGKPYPSKENAELLRKDRERLAKQYEALRAAVSKSEIKVPDRLDPIVFQQSLYQKWDGWRRSATDAGIKLPDKFAFGFSRYFEVAPCADVKGDDCARRLRLLMKELLIVERVTDLLITNRVENILGIRRPEVEGNPSADTLGVVSGKESSSGYEALPFEFRFSCGTENLREVLNGLSHSEYLFIVRSLTVSSEIVQDQSPAVAAVNPLFVAPAAQSLGAASSTTRSARRRLVVTIYLASAEFPKSQKGN
jgi:hypothetical protein